MSWIKDTTVMTINHWHAVAISYDGVTGSVQTYVDGVLDSYNIGRLVQGLTTGSVVLGSRYYIISLIQALQMIDTSTERWHA